MNLALDFLAAELRDVRWELKSERARNRPASWQWLWQDAVDTLRYNCPGGSPYADYLEGIAPTKRIHAA